MRLSLERSAERAELVENAFTRIGAAQRMRSGPIREAAVRIEASMTLTPKLGLKLRRTLFTFVGARPIIMSRHRHVRNINIHDELEDDALSDGGGYDMTPEQQGMTSVAPRSSI